MVRSKFKNNRCCLWSSKAVILILLWNLIISVGFQIFLNPSLYIGILNIDEDTFYGYYTIALLVHGLTYGLSALVFVFYPLAGFLADVYWGRYATVKKSLCFLFWSMVIMIFLAGLALLGSIPMIDNVQATPDNTAENIVTTLICIVFGIPAFLGIMLCFCSIVAFSANVIQFGMDQLHDAPAESSTLYIHWYVWSSQIGPFTIRLLVGIVQGFQTYTYYIIIALVIGSAIAFLPVTLWWEKCLRRWFLIDQGNTNPYKLVYKVIKFAKDHTNPIRRSAFTYCEDKLPSRLDLGKEKYGGSFTTEEVENVKAFLGILRVLLTVGPMFFVEFAFSDMILSLDQTNGVSWIPYNFVSSLFTPVLILVLIPIYLCLLKPFIRAYIPGMLKRMGLGMMLLLLSGLCTLVMGIVGNNCKHDYYYYCGLSTYLTGISTKFLMIQFTLNAVSYLLFYISAFEFICAQCPHSMKGLLIGMFFAIKGVFKLLGVLLLYIPTALKCNPFDLIVHIDETVPVFPICGFIYYFINVVIALLGIVAFAIVAKRYEYRERDEPDNIYRYAEEYYANAQDEPNYDYDDYDNLNVETIS